ncbi:P27 family phage terminase small subunit [Rhodococcus sp. Chr-9]|uniref:P27 family phage terminase small subunit n=1 Tax=Rhodococcus sp. Chr-9 TaxID=713612 RepID=UPI001F36FFE7|nr:P27 family phage terminase small subunit [Rhodococcus sp. Chr-9]
MAGRPKTRARKAAEGAGVVSVPSVDSWQRPPFEKGNTLSLQHGAHSPRTVEPIAQQWVDIAREQAPYLRDPSYEPALLSWARFEAKCDLLHAWIDEHGMFDTEGNPVPAAKILDRYEGRAASLRATLGMDPVSRAKLQKDAAATKLDLAALMAQETHDDRND